MDLTAGKPLAAAMLALLAASTALAQLGDEIPHASYHAASQAIYTGDYRSTVPEAAVRRAAPSFSGPFAVPPALAREMLCRRGRSEAWIDVVRANKPQNSCCT